MRRSVLMIAYHLPPLRGSSGIQRAMRFAQYLPEFGWTPILLGPHQRAYPKTAADPDTPLASDMPIERAFALDAQRHLAISGRYPHWLAIPDRWASWWLGAVPLGLRLIRQHQPCAIWSTYPIATAHLIALTLHRITGLPWICDMRDPMVAGDFPRDRLRRAAHSRIEAQSLAHGNTTVVVTSGMARLLTSRYPACMTRIAVIENGFDESEFAHLEAETPTVEPPRDGFTLLHSGIVYPDGRDPTCLFLAIGQLASRGLLARTGFRLVLRASGQNDHLGRLIMQTGVSEWVHLLPAIPYRDALREMLRADALLLLQAADNNDTVPAKAYEYLRAGRPILALTDPAGDTGTLLRSHGIGTIAPLDSVAAIADVLGGLIARVRGGSVPTASQLAISRYDRKALTERLARLLNETITSAGLVAIR